MGQVIPCDELSEAALYIDAMYEGKGNGNASDDPLHALLGVSVQGGFRILGSREQPRLVVLTRSSSFQVATSQGYSKRKGSIRERP
jgi:hypothetical protein